MKNTKLLLVILLAITLMLPFTACKPAGDSGSSDKITIGVCIYKYDDTYMSSVRQAIEAEAAGHSDVELKMNDSKGDQATQNDQIDALIQMKVNVLAINIVDIGAVQTVLDKAKAADLPVVFFNREPDAAILATYDKARFVGTKPEEAGIIQGDIIVDQWNTGAYDTNGDGKLQYVMLMGDADNPEAQARTTYSVKTANDKGIQTEELGMQVCNWDSDKANTAMSAWIAKYGDGIEMVIANNDGMASGAITALQAAGYNNGGGKFIPVFGVDATEEAQKLIADGVMSGTVKQDAQGMAKGVFSLAYNAGKGKDWLEGTSYTFDSTNAVRIPYLPFAGSGQPAGGGGDKKITIGVCIYKYDDTYMSSVRQAIEAEAAGNPNVELKMNDSKGDQATQNDQIDALIQMQVDVLAINIVDIGAVQTVLDKAKAANLPIVFFNREPDAAILATYDKARFVGTKPEEAGIIQGEIIVDLWNTGKYDTSGDGKLQYVMLMGDADNPEAQARTTFSVKTANDKGVGTEELGMQVCNWDADKANTAVSAWFARFGDKIEMVIANNDGMASGAIAALQTSGYNNGDDKFIPVVGVDATEEAQQLIADGFMSGTVKQDAQGMAKGVFSLAYNAGQGKDWVDGTSYTFDETNAIRIPYLPFSG